MPDASVQAVFDAGVGAGAPRHWPETPALTHDADTNLALVLESEALRGACEAYRAGAKDELTELRCGKWMFFYETFGTTGIPTVLLEFNQKFYADTFFGRGFEALHFVADPDSTTGMPLGLAPSTAKLGTVETSALTCAACHFGQLPDGRYAVGYANWRLEYGRFIATLGAPLSLGLNASDPKIHPSVRAMLAQAVATAKTKSGYLTQTALTGLKLLGAGTTGSFALEDQARLVALRSGTMDFLMKPLVDDGVWTVSRILSLWNLPSPAQRTTSQMPHEMLSWNGGVSSLGMFVDGFVVIGASGDAWSPERLAPLQAYVRSLRAPAPLVAVSQAATESGAELFVQKGCLMCHTGPSGEGARVFSFDELQTDSEYSKIYNPGPSGAPCCGLGTDASLVTRGVKAPRMSGLFSQSRFLHNGSVGSLEQLFCVTPRSTDTSLGQLAGGHQQTCTGLTDGEKRALIEYLGSL